VTANSSYVSTVKFHPNTAGDRDIHVTAVLGDLMITDSTSLSVSEVNVGTDSCTNPLSSGINMVGRVRQKRDTAMPNQFRSHSKDARGVNMHLSGVKRLSGPLNLRTATVSIDRLLLETGGAGELIRNANGDKNLPLILSSARKGWRNLAIFRSPAEQRPAVNLVLVKRNGWLWMHLHVKSDFPLAPQLCNGNSHTTTLETRITSIDDGVNPPFMWPVSAEWKCKFDSSGNPNRLLLRE